MKKMNIENKKLPLLVMSSILLLSSPDAISQFKKFKSKPRFNQDAKPSSYRDDANNTKAFGQRTKQLAPIKDSKFVNLNPETAFGPDIVTSFDFPDTDIMEITKHMQKLTGINLILDKDVKGKVSITAPTAITVGDAWKAYLAALNMAGYTIVKSGAFYKIINTRDVRYVPTKIYTGSYTPETEAHIMKVIALANVDAAEISRNFRPFMSRYGRIIDIKQTNTIIISDTGANITRLEKLIKFLDVPGHEETLQIIKVQNSSAQEIAKLLDEILKSGSSSSSRRSSSSSSKRFSGSSKGGSQNISKIIAEPRTNSIIAMANATGAKELRKLINKLDVKYSSTSSGKVHVLYLNYGNAEELSKTLSSLVTNSSPKSSSSSSSSRSFISRRTKSSTLFTEEVKITADKNNNALVVTASPTDWLTLRSVIKKLDIPRDQVYVEGMIMETTITKTRGFGVEYAGAYGAGAAQRTGFMDSGNLSNLLTGQIQNIGGFFAGITAGGTREITLPNGDTTTVNSINGVLKAIASNSQTNVLATPQILALDNTEAEFEVGSTVPVKNQTTTNGTVSNSTTNQEAKLSLKITPQINKVTRFVKLKINQSINDFVGELDTSGNGQATNTRSAVTEVMVRDRDTIAMGGLLRDRTTVSLNKIPLLGDIPVLGWLFKNKQKSTQKVNLLFFLTPKILSPYAKTASKNTLEALENRTNHLKDVINEDEISMPHKSASKDLKAKLIKQTDGPLYDDRLNEYRDTNEGNGIGPSSEQNDLNDTPDYSSIVNGNKGQ